MFDNLKIGKKMLVLSGTILGLLLIVLFVGMDGLSNTVKSGQKVAAGDQLNSELAQLEIDHLNWAGKVSTFFNDDSVNELDVQMDHSQCRFGKWYYGEGRQHAEQMLPELRSNLQAIEEPHTKLHASARKIKGAYRAADPHLPQFLTEKELDHTRWAVNIQEAIINKDNGVKIQLDPTKCSLGKFLYGEEGNKAAAANPELAKVLEALKAPHEQLHKHGEKINKLLHAGDSTGAAAYFSTEAVSTLEKVGQLVHNAGQVATAALKGQQQAKQIFITETEPNLQKVQKQFEQIREQVSTNGEVLSEKSASAVKTQNTTVLSIGVIALLLGIVIAIMISRSLTGPMRKTVSILEELEKGHLNNRLQLNRKDEIGQMAESMDRFADSLQNEMVDSLQKLAAGDLTFDVIPRDEQDELRGAIKKLGSDLNDIMGQILVAGDEISSASGEIADSSQSLSQGATESAASLEEISASLNETSSQTTVNAENAATARGLSEENKHAAENGSAQMQEMVSAMTDINEAGQNISKIIKTIDEIAFQTNLLALNAAVEAARAGQHGKGFAVVAEEVRNLAARSAKAAAETAELIEGSVAKTANGSVIANQTAEALQEIVTGVSKVTDLVAEIAAASHEQAQGVAEINQGVSQIDTVTQQNTASAEESAAAAEEMSAQAAQLRHMLQRFTLKQIGPGRSQSSINSKNVGNVRPHLVKSDSPSWKGVELQQRETPAESQQQIALDDGEFGKY
ncbi:MAG: methyl-accepting chemotaxis protein [Desulfuromusa sp.]|jgi:methyl-accepting chemotaxis protein|nr:methyl-accepting chemotaxis protein [Desulfuromusa sp.]